VVRSDSERRPNLLNAFSRVADDLWAEQADHNPAVRLKQICLAGVVNSLPERRVELQAIGVYQDPSRCGVGKIRSRQESALAIADFMLLRRLGEASGTYRPEQGQLNRRFAVKGGVKRNHRGGAKGDQFKPVREPGYSRFGAGWSEALRGRRPSV